MSVSNIWGETSTKPITDTHLESIFIRTGPNEYQTKQAYMESDPHKDRVHIEVKQNGRMFRNCSIHLSQEDPLYKKAVSIVDELAKTQMLTTKVKTVDQLAARKLFPQKD